MVNNENLLIKNYLSNMQVKLLVANQTRCWPGWHETDYVPGYNKLYFICEGSCRLKIAGKEFITSPNHIYLMPSGVLQSYSLIDGIPLSKYWCHFTATIGDMNLFDIINTDYCIAVEDVPLLSSMFERLISGYIGTSMSDLLRAQAALFDILAFYLERSCSGITTFSDSPASEKLNMLLDYIEKHISEDISINELAALIYLHPNYLIRFFKKHTGYSPIHYINMVKLERAKSLLAGTNLPIKQVALVTGFSDFYYFSRNFKNSTGFSPTEFRKLQLQS